MHEIYGIVNKDESFWWMQRKLDTCWAENSWTYMNMSKCIYSNKSVYDDTIVNHKKNIIHGGGWEVLKEQLWWDYFRECFGITPLGKLLSWESSCVVQGHTEISCPWHQLFNLPTESLLAGRQARALLRLAGEEAVRMPPLREHMQCDNTARHFLPSLAEKWPLDVAHIFRGKDWKSWRKERPAWFEQG